MDIASKNQTRLSDLQYLQKKMRKARRVGGKHLIRAIFQKSRSYGKNFRYIMGMGDKRTISKLEDARITKTFKDRINLIDQGFITLLVITLLTSCVGVSLKPQNDSKMSDSKF